MKIKVLFTILAALFLFGWAAAQTTTYLPASTNGADGEKVDPSRVKGYMLGPGDEITVKVLGEQDFDFVSAVDEDGKLVLPFDNQSIAAQCRTERDVRADLLKILQKYLRNPQVSLRVIEYGKSRPAVSIYGEVRNPQPIKMLRTGRLVEILAFAGGVTEEAGGTVQVSRPQPPLCADPGELDKWKAAARDASGIPTQTFNLNAIFAGRAESNPSIYPGDVIKVERALPAYVTGEVANSQGIYIKEGGLSLTEAIAKLGGIKQGAKTKDIKIYRLKPNAPPESKDRDILSANYDMIKKGQQKDILLKPYDIVEVDKAKESLGVSILKLAIGAGTNTITSVTQGVGYHIFY